MLTKEKETLHLIVDCLLKKLLPSSFKVHLACNPPSLVHTTILRYSEKTRIISGCSTKIVLLSLMTSIGSLSFCSFSMQCCTESAGLFTKSVDRYYSKGSFYLGQSLFLCDTSAADPAAFDMLLLIIGLDVILKVSS